MTLSTWSSCFHHHNAEITGPPHLLWERLEIKPGVLCTLSKHSANWTTYSALFVDAGALLGSYYAKHTLRWVVPPALVAFFSFWRFIYFCFLKCVCGSCPHECLCTTCMQCPQRPEEGVGAPRTGVKRFVSHHAGAGNQTVCWSFERSHWCSHNHGTLSPTETFSKNHLRNHIDTVCLNLIKIEYYFLKSNKGN